MQLGLDRTLITGPLDCNTPLAVIWEVAEAHGLPTTSELATLNSSGININTNDPQLWSYLARYVNKRAEWPLTALRKAVSFLSAFQGTRDAAASSGIASLLAQWTTNQLPPAWKVTLSSGPFGPATPLQPTSLNACQTYGLCCHLNIKLESQASITRYQAALTSYFNPPPGHSLLTLMEQWRNIPAYKRGIILAELPEVTQAVSQPPYDPELLAEAIEAARYQPKDLARENYDVYYVIAEAALRWHIDLSDCRDPLATYYQLTSRTTPTELASRIHSPHKELDSPHLNVRFNPKLPANFYTHDMLRDLALKNGYTLDEISRDQPYSVLQAAALTATFFPGKVPPFQPRNTVDSDDSIIELADNECVSWGVSCLTSQRSGANLPHFVCFSYSELLFGFSSLRFFANPNERLGSHFPFPAVRKLLNILVKLKSSTTDSRPEWDSLIDIIPKTISFLVELNEAACELLQQWEHQEAKDEITALLQLLLKLTMTMRGWLGVGPYPVAFRREELRIRSQVLLITVHVLEEFKEASQSPLGQLFNGLPLYAWHSGSFYRSVDRSEGLTLGERLVIVRQGEDHEENSNSCIRISSNWFAASYVKYCLIFGVEPEFDINELGSIS